MVKSLKDKDIYCCKPEIPAPGVAEIAAVVITHHPKRDFSERVASITSQVGKLIIVDNNSNGDALSMLRGIAFSRDTELIENNENLGIAAALNQGVQLAIAQGYSWILTLDQDSKPAPDMVTELIAAYMHSPARNKVALLAPISIDERSGRAELGALCNGHEIAEIKIAQTSGSLLAANGFTQIGPFREDFFIDYVDTEYCLRLRKAGFSIILSCNAKLLHNLGASTVHRLPWARYAITSNHDPLRRYFITRNRFLVMKMYAVREPRWTIKELQAFVKEVIKIVLFEDSRKEKCTRLLKGIIDALLNRTGKFRGSHELL